jgi:hypothetical protein
MHDKQTRPRKYPGEAEAVSLLHWLNVKHPSGARQLAIAKVERSMALVKSLRAAAESCAGQKPSRAWSREQEELNLAFYEHDFVNRVDPDPLHGLKWSECPNTDLISRDYIPGEAEAMAKIRDLDKMGVLARVRQCQCERYFFARFERQRFHAKECRERFWEQSAERKKQRQEWARNNYLTRRTIELGSSKAAQRKRRG